MSNSFPSRSELEQLPLRALVAYALRAARRISPVLRDIIPNDVLNDTLRLVELVVTADRIEDDRASIAAAIAHIVGMSSAAPKELKSLRKTKAVVAITSSAMAAIYVIEAVCIPSRAQEKRRRAADESSRAARLDGEYSEGALTDARHDYDLLVSQYGLREEVVIGDPVRCFDNLRREGRV